MDLIKSKSFIRRDIHMKSLETAKLNNIKSWLKYHKSNYNNVGDLIKHYELMEKYSKRIIRSYIYKLTFETSQEVEPAIFIFGKDKPLKKFTDFIRIDNISNFKYVIYYGSSLNYHESRLMLKDDEYQNILNLNIQVVKKHIIKDHGENEIQNNINILTLNTLNKYKENCQFF